MLDILWRLCYTIRMNYKKIYEKLAAFYRAHPRAKKLLLISNYGITGLFILAYGALCIASFFLWEKPDILKIFFIPLGCLVLVTLMRAVIRRPRPYTDDGADIDPILHKKNRDMLSFPSRHISSAFSIAIVFFPYCLWAGSALIPLGLALGYVRFALGLHYPTDLFGGVAVGLASGLFLLI